MERQKHRKKQCLVTETRDFPRFGCIVWAKTSAKPILLRLPGRETSVFTSPSPGRGRNRSLRRPGRAGEAPGGPKTGPRAAQEPPRAPQEPPRAGQSGPGGPPGGPQEGPKRAPKGPLGGQGRPRAGKRLKKFFLDTPRSANPRKIQCFLGGPFGKRASREPKSVAYTVFSRPGSLKSDGLAEKMTLKMQPNRRIARFFLSTNATVQHFLGPGRKKCRTVAFF